MPENIEKKIPDRPDYESPWRRKMDDALVELREAAAEADDDYHHELATNVLGSLRIDARGSSTSAPAVEAPDSPLEATAMLPEEQTHLEGTTENAVLSLRGEADELEARDEIDGHLQDVIEGIRLVADQLADAVERSYASRESGGVARTASDVSELEAMLGWNSVAIFSAGKHFEGDTIHVNKDTTLVVMADPWPEYHEIVFLDGEFHHQEGLTGNSYEAVLREQFESHGEARIVPLSAVDCVGRDDHGTPHYIGEGSDA